MTAAGRTLKLVKDRMPHVKTIIGGNHVPAISGQTFREEAVNFVIKGEKYIPTVDLLRRLKEKRDTFIINGFW